MRRQLLVNGAIFALALGTLGLVWATRETPGTGERQARVGKLLPSFNKDTVASLVLRRGAERLELVRAGEEFRIVAPWKERAEIASVRSLLGSLDLASPLRPADEVPRQHTGLGQPRLEIDLQSAQGRQKLVLGGAAPAPAGAYYAEVTSAGLPPRLYTVSQGLVAELDLPFNKFRETRLLEYGASEVASIEVSRAGVVLEIVLDPNGERWFQIGERKELADRETVEAMFTALSMTSTEHFLEPVAARAALSHDFTRFRLQPKSSASPPVDLSVGGVCPDTPERVVVLREGAGIPVRAGCIPREVGNALQVDAQNLRLKTPCFARTDEVEELSIRAGGAKLELLRKDTAFLLRAPTTGPVPLDAGNQRVTDIVRALGTRVDNPDLAALGLEPVAGELTVQASGVKERARSVERVLLGKPLADGSLCLRRERDNVVLCLAKETARAFRPDATLLKELNVMTFAASELARLSIERDGFSERVVRSADGSYRLEAPAGFIHDGSLVADAVQTLGSLRAERWVSDSDDGSFGLDKPRLRVTVELVDGADGAPRRRGLSFGAVDRGGVFARLDTDPGVFVVPRSELSAFDTSFVDRSLSPTPEAALSGLTLAAAGRRLELRREGEAWRSSGSVSQTRVLELVEALTSLRADFTVHLGPEKPSEGLAKPTLSITFTERNASARRLRIGSADSLRNTRIFYARLEGVDATFAIAQSALSGLQDF